jgi:hypothetical protein
MIHSALKNLVKKIPFLWTLLTWSKDRVLILLRLKDVLIMMILFHIWPEQTYRFATRKTLPSKKNRFSRKSKEIFPYDLLKSKSTNIPLMEEINIVGIGSSFNLDNLKNLKGPIFHPGWGVLREDKNGKVFYKHHHSYENQNTVDAKELFEDKINKDLKHVTYGMSRKEGIELFKKNDNKVVAVNGYGMDKDGKYYPLNDEWETSSYLKLFDHDQSKLISIVQNICQLPLPSPGWVPTKSFLPTLCGLSFFAKKVNVYGWDNYLASSPENMNYWELFFQMYKYKLDIGYGFFEVGRGKYRRMTKEHFESSLINIYYGYHLSKMPKFVIHGYLGKLDKHYKLVEKIEKVLFN